MIWTIPNLLTLVRMGLVPVFIIFLVDGEPRRALAVFVIAGVTDALDGAIARFWKQKSLLGAYLDPIADKLLLMSGYVALSVPALNHGTPIPTWVTVLVIARDVLIVIVALVLYLAAGFRSFPPSWLSKITTGVQVAALVLVLLSAVLSSLRSIDLAAAVALYLAAGLTVASGLDYVIRYARGGRQGDKETRGQGDRET
jgi:cardiolipin synthase